jgi:2,3-dimethylmalate lyase
VLRRVTSCVGIPVIADIDTGFGGPLSVRRTVREVEAAGAAAVQIEDQVAPKRCGHFEDQRVVELDEAVERVTIAVDARRSADTVVVARTDAIAAIGLDAAIERARHFAAAGADVVFVEAIESAEQLGEVAASLAGVPLLYNAVEGGRSPLLSREVLEAAGVRILIHPITLLLETIRTQQDALAALTAGRSASEATIRLARDVVRADEAMGFRPRPTAPAS